jgi:2-(1,2-epoxy-1,2-dihydrophenyl)acetyl-CoA isomerase
MAYETILCDVADGVATITLNRPDRLNALTHQMFDELQDALSKVEADPDQRAVVLTGAGRGFCAGADLKAALEAEDGEGPENDLETHYNPLVKRLQTIDVPVIGAINGVAAGAGCSVALSCDIVLAGRSASFLQAFARIGLIPDAGSTWMMPRLIGRARAKGLAMLADNLPAETAADWGMIWKVVDDDVLEAEAGTLARNLAQGPTAAFAKMKHAFNASMDNSLDDQLALEAKLQNEAAQSHDYKEGVDAFLEKRPAVFKGN